MGFGAMRLYPSYGNQGAASAAASAAPEGARTVSRQASLRAKISADRRSSGRRGYDAPLRLDKLGTIVQLVFARKLDPRALASRPPLH